MISPDLSILRHLAASTHASAAEIGIACWMALGEVRSRLARPKSLRHVGGRTDQRLVSLARLFLITGEARKRAQTGQQQRQMRNLDVQRGEEYPIRSDVLVSFAQL